MMRKRYTRNNSENKTTRFLPQKKQKVCTLKDVDSSEVDFKNIAMLTKFVSGGGRILPRKVTGLCCKHQRKVRSIVKIARFLALLPFCISHCR